MIGLVCEKPSQARNFAAALGGMTGTFNGEQYMIVALRGHLYGFSDDLSDQIDMNHDGMVEKYTGAWSLDKLPWSYSDFKWKYSRKKDTSALLKDLKAKLSTVDEIAISTDLDPSGEGDLLAIEVLINLGLLNKKLTRLSFEDESAKQIQKAFKSRKQLPPINSYGVYQKALFRTKWDYMSMQFTRIATLVSGSPIPIRQGRLKSAMVVLVGNRLKEIKEYVKAPKYVNAFKDENENVFKSKLEPRFDNINQVIKKTQNGTVKVISEEVKRQAPGKLYDLSGLSAVLAPKGIKPKELLDIYQKMYEAKIVSYPRTEDKKITEEQYNEMLPIVDSIAKVVGVDSSKLTVRTPRREHVGSGMSHGANRPGSVVPTTLSSLDSTFGKGASLIYETLAKNFLSIFAEDYVYKSIKANLLELPYFESQITVPVSLGYKDIMSGIDSDDEESTSKGFGTVATPFVAEEINPKPSNPTFKWLVSQLDKYEIGTGATRTSTYAEVTNKKVKGYLLEDNKGKITMTPSGETSYSVVVGSNIGSLEVTKKLEEDMKRVEKFEVSPDVLLNAISNMVSEDMLIMRENAKKKGLKITEMEEKITRLYVPTGEMKSIKPKWSTYTLNEDEITRLFNGEKLTDLDLPKKSGGTFKGNLFLGDGTFEGKTFFGVQMEFSTSKSIPSVFCGHTFTEAEKMELLAGRSIFVEGMTSKAGKKFNANISYNDNDGIKLAF